MAKKDKYKIHLQHDTGRHIGYSIPLRLVEEDLSFTTHSIVVSEEKAQWIATVLQEYIKVQQYLLKHAVEVDDAEAE